MFALILSSLLLPHPRRTCGASPGEAGARSRDRVFVFVFVLTTMSGLVAAGVPLPAVLVLVVGGGWAAAELAGRLLGPVPVISARG